MFNYWIFKNWWWVGLGKSGGRKIDVGVLYGVELGCDYLVKVDWIWNVRWNVGGNCWKWYGSYVVCDWWYVYIVGRIGVVNE